MLAGLSFAGLAGWPRGATAWSPSATETADLCGLASLDLSGNALADLAPLSDLWSLRRLDVGGNPAADLSPLGDLEPLEWLRVPAANGSISAATVSRTWAR